MRRMSGVATGVVFGFLSVFMGLTSSAHAASNPPDCFDRGQRLLTVNNPQVLEWRSTTQDQFQARALIQGTITTLYPEKTGHAHFAVNLDHQPQGDIEIIYNQEFGELPQLRPGMKVSACGDYITAGPRSRLPSPMGAIIHWVHYNPGDRDGGAHPHGFLMIDGTVYGFSSKLPRNDF